MVVTAQQNIMMQQLASLTGATAGHTATLNHEQENGFSKIGLTTKSLIEHYLELDISKWKGSNLFFGANLDDLPPIVLLKTPEPEVLSYVQKRKKTIDDLVQAFELAQKVSKPEETPALLKAFIAMCNEARSEAIIGDRKGLDTMDSVHLIELEKAALKAAEGDKRLSSILSRDSKAYINNPILMEATLKVLKERQEGLGKLESAYNANAVKNGGAGHVADFFREEWLGVASVGTSFCKVNALNHHGVAIITEAKQGAQILNHYYDDVDKVYKYTQQLGNGSSLALPIPADAEITFKKRNILNQMVRNMWRRTSNAFNLIVNNFNLKGFNKFCDKVPGKGKGVALIAAGLIWGGSEVICFMKNNPKWSKPITDGYTRLTENYSNPLGFFADWFIPDPGKIIGRPIWTSESLNHLKREFKDL